MKKEYTRPELVEYGDVEQLTLGSGGSQADVSLVNGGLITDNNNCYTSISSQSCLNAS